ncbi:hypothetical protein ELI36_37485 [Rhizobium ruizarguesonis]|uniref:Peroxidase n=1 Tax=Rhizobium ruizarguesonis TaxID=2081791 RepID=A0ABY1WYJ8_9HYPH|nr:hypothetical protein [Rhizobium ruizarguesonis]TAU13169.1 hypothetical protein ELI48_37620 [Rhizobium ruizarguesonis]TAU58434.1 hypothetical protein ELI45_32870 [Rhizobium ruizarguesonis]TAV03194.1 hypothetical protein ELI34_32780 [Rhizobium ruizarguesonis]TAV19126.1 hypothetical protein ELI36_37485 [Rhizobium ruizarguesonis]TAV19811.1 hypothetical protein ELI33_38325 [Rhizobium ruizarguesonis]
MVDLANLQSLITRRSGKPLYAVLLLQLGATAKAGSFIGELLPQIASGDTSEVVGESTINLFLSWRAITILVEGHQDLDPSVGRRQFDPFFSDIRQGPGSIAMADQLGFTGLSSPERWWSNFKTEDIDFAVYLGCDNDQQRRATIARVRDLARAADILELAVPTFPDRVITGYTPSGGRLHFGYRDGITTPDVDWEDRARVGAVNLREFVMGYPTQDFPTTPYPAGPWREFARDGSFACLTWIEQDVSGFEAFLSQYAPILAPSFPKVDPKEWLAAQIMGRWRDGSPLVRYSSQPPLVPDLDNNFGYADDSSGARCPLGAHIRVAYSRDQPLSFANKSRFPKGPPRLIRRGFSYGPPVEDPTAIDDQDRGLFGIFLCARVNEQFYTVLRWMQQTEFSDVFDDVQPGRSGQDMLTGTRLPGGGNRTPDSEVEIALAETAVSISLKSFIRHRGAAVLFVPSITALQTLVAA